VVANHRLKVKVRLKVRLRPNREVVEDVVDLGLDALA
jgi:hypothetical protein